MKIVSSVSYDSFIRPQGDIMFLQENIRRPKDAIKCMSFPALPTK